MKILDGIQQGSSDWLAIRANHFCASEAPAMMGVSKYSSRNDLLRQKATGIAPEIDAGKQRLFDAGHAAEEAARSVVEELLGEPLYPSTITEDIDGLPLLASLDGMNMEGLIIWETKLLNQSLVSAVQAEELDPNYWTQIEHQLLVTGAAQCFFTTSDGTPEGTYGMWYKSVPERRQQIIAGWKQFANDLANYQLPEIIPAAIAAPQMALPAVSIQVQGRVALIDNLSVFGEALTAYVERINKSPETDDDFATLEATVKTLKTAEEALDAAENGALAQTDSIDAMRRTVGLYRDLARTNRLTVEKLVKAEKENRRNSIIQVGRQKLVDLITTLNQRIGKNYMPTIPADFAGVVKGLKTISSIQNAVDTKLARATIEANEIAGRIQDNMAMLREQAKDYIALFADTAQLVMKSPEDLALVIQSRIDKQKSDDAQRIADAAEKLVEEKLTLAAPSVPVAKVDAAGHGYAVSAAASNNGTVPHAATPIDTGATMKLGEICALLEFTVTADFLSALGFPVVKTEKNSKLYRQSDFPRICMAISAHAQAVAGTDLRKAA